MVDIVYKVPMNFERDTRYVHGPASNDLWTPIMLLAQENGRPITSSGEWSDAQRHYRIKFPAHERRFIATPAWTGTVLDYIDGTLNERIKLNPDGSFAECVALGEADGIYLPTESGLVRNLHDKYMPLIARLHNVKDPRTELDPDAYFEVYPYGRHPVVRGRWVWPSRGSRRVAVYATCGPAGGGFAAWFVDDKPPTNAVIYTDYEAFEKVLRIREAELREQIKLAEMDIESIQKKLAEAVVLME